MRPIDVLRLATPAASGGGGGGGGGGTVTLSNRTITKISSTSSATARITISSDRNVYNQAGTLLETWLSAGDPVGFEVKATQTGGNYTGSVGDDTVGAWLSLSTARSWSEDAILGDIQNVTFSISIREAVTHTVRATATIILNADDSGYNTSTGGGPAGGQIP